MFIQKTVALVLSLALSLGLAFLLASCGGSATTTAATTGGTAEGSFWASDCRRQGPDHSHYVSDPGSLDQDFVAFDLIALALHKNIYPYLIDYGVTTADGAEVQDTSNIIPKLCRVFHIR